MRLRVSVRFRNFNHDLPLSLGSIWKVVKNIELDVIYAINGFSIIPKG